MSFTISLSGSESVLTTNFFPPIELPQNENFEIGLVNFHTFNSIPNIDEHCNKIYIDDFIITISIGSYELNDINEYIKKQLEGKNVTFDMTANNNTQKCLLKCSKLVNFEPEDSIYNLLGFEREILEPNIQHESKLPVNILKINSVSVECNLINAVYSNGNQAHTLYDFFPVVPPGFKIVQEPENVIYLPLNTHTIDNITLHIVDQDRRMINFRGEVISIRLHIRKYK